jgi:hypothetical protein
MYYSVGIGINMDYNLFYANHSGSVFNEDGNDYTQAQWSSWKTATGWESNSPTPADPLFVNAPTNLKVYSESDAIDGGEAFTEYTTDYEGVAVGSPPNIGAYETNGGNFPADYFVGADGVGSDGNPGTYASPWATLAYALTQTSSGDTICLLHGTHTMGNTNVGVGESIRGIDSTKTTVSLTNTTDYQAGWALASGTVDTDGNQSIFDIKFVGSNTSWNAIYVAARSNVRIHDCSFSNFDDCAVIFNGMVSMGGSGSDSEPYCSDNRFYNNRLVNVTTKSGATANGALRFGLQEDMLIYGNYFNETSGADATKGYPMKYYNSGYIRDIDIYDNTIIKTPASTTQGTDWNFALELWQYRGNVKIYNNHIEGSIDIGETKSLLGHDTILVIRDNYFGYSTMPNEAASRNNAAWYLEGECLGPIYIERNTVQNIGVPIQLYPRDGLIDSVYFRYNLFNGIGAPDDANRNSTVLYGYASESGADFKQIYFDNNTVYVGADATAPYYGYKFPEITNVEFDSIYIRNNIFDGFNLYPIYSNMTGAMSIDYLWEENNNYYNNGTNAASHAGTSPTNYTNQNNITTDPDWTNDPTNFRLKAASNAVGAGKDLGLDKDIEGVTVGSPPNIGAYETEED